METTKLSSKGQLILPKAVREAHPRQPGTELSVEDTGDGILLRPARHVVPTGIEDVAGRLRVDGPVKTWEETEPAIDAEVKNVVVAVDANVVAREQPDSSRNQTRTSSPMQRRRVGIIYPLTIAPDREDGVVSDAVTEMAEGVQQRIRDLAYLKWESAGRQHGLAMQYWLAAEKEVLGIKRPPSASVAEKQAGRPAPKRSA